MKLAINGGDPVRVKPFPAYNTIGPEEKEDDVVEAFEKVWKNINELK